MKTVTITYTMEVMDRDVEGVKKEVANSICAEMDGTINLYLDCPLINIGANIQVKEKVMSLFDEIDEIRKDREASERRNRVKWIKIEPQQIAREEQADEHPCSFCKKRTTKMMAVETGTYICDVCIKKFGFMIVDGPHKKMLWYW